MHMSKRQFAAFLFALFIITVMATAFLLAGSTPAGASASTGFSHGSTLDPVTPDWAWRKNWEPCANDEEQPKRCVWNARTMGNGLGSSYILTDAGKILRIPHRDAAALLRPIVY